VKLIPIVAPAIAEWLRILDNEWESIRAVLLQPEEATGRAA